MKKCSEAWKIIKHFKSSINYEEYRILRNKENSMVTDDDNAHRKMTLKGFKGNPKRFYGYIRGLQSVVDSIPELRKDDGCMTETDEETASELVSNRCLQQTIVTL